jgi:hypothetical protein
MNRTPERRQFMVETPPTLRLTATGRLASACEER